MKLCSREAGNFVVDYFGDIQHYIMATYTMHDYHAHYLIERQSQKHTKCLTVGQPNYSTQFYPSFPIQLEYTCQAH